MTPQCAPPISAADRTVVRRPAILLAAAAGVLVSCGQDDPGTAVRECRPVVALVASSVTAAFGESAGNTCADVWKVTGGSSTALAAQVQEGSPADVFVSAGSKAVDQLRSAGLTVGEPVPLGSVRATLLVPVSLEGTVTLRDLPARVAGGWKVGACVASAPCGTMADQLLANASEVWGAGFDRESIVSTEAESADALVSRIAMGELDAGIIYEYACGPVGGTSDTTVRCIDIPDTVDGHVLNVRTPYFAVRLNTSDNAESFMDHVASAGFRDFLSKWLRIS